jgi:PadR family transcriptional regulator PadR
MPQTTPLGEFEQVVLLAVLQAGEHAFALSIIRELDERAGRRVDRGALYKTLDRLETKGLVKWKTEPSTPARGGHRRRLFRVTAAGVRALQTSRATLFKLWDGLEPVLGQAPHE